MVYSKKKLFDIEKPMKRRAELAPSVKIKTKKIFEIERKQQMKNTLKCYKNLLLKSQQNKARQQEESKSGAGALPPIIREIRRETPIFE